MARPIYGARLGILMLEARFPRIPGDMGHAGTWPFPVLYKVVKDASPQRVVAERAEGLLPSFVEAAKELEALGADGITTNCGFLSLYQKELAAAVTVPVATSSLMQVPMIQSTLPAGKRVGVITVSAAGLTRDHLVAIGLDPSLPVVGTDGGREFTRVLIGNELTMDVAAAEQDILDAGDALVRKHSGHRCHTARMHKHGALCTSVARSTRSCPFSIFTVSCSGSTRGSFPAISAIRDHSRDHGVSDNIVATACEVCANP